MENTPKSLRLQLAICGRINAGKSTLLNLIADQDTAITSPERGTTTDVVEKTMELRPLGPVVLLDTAGIDDDSPLGGKRTGKTAAAVDRADAVLLTVVPGEWGEPEEKLLAMTRKRGIPLLPVVNLREAPADKDFAEKLRERSGHRPLLIDAADRSARDHFLDRLTDALAEMLPDRSAAPPYLRDLLPENALVVLMTPIDTQAPRGRLIMPEAQAIRDALDGDASVVVAKENAFPAIYGKLTEKPALAVCDSQVVHRMIETTDPTVPLTTFSVLMSRLKGDIGIMAAGCAAIARLRDGDQVLVAEACTHHEAENDIGRVQIPALLRKKTGAELDIRFSAGADYPADLRKYRLIVHCGGCMLNRRAMLNRIREAVDAGVPICNYGMCISYCRGVLERVLSLFPEALEKYRASLDKTE